MVAENFLILGILIVAVALFASEKLRADVVAMLVLLSLIVTGLLTVNEAFQGFANPAVVTVWAVFIISGGVLRSGIADLMARYLLQWAGQNENRLLIFLMLGAGLMSAVINNIGAVAILMPVVISIGRKMAISPSKLLMPLAFAALLGGNVTLIGTPPNILAASIMQDYGLEPFGFFDFAPTGLLVLGVGILYMMLLGRRLIPDRIPPGGYSQEYHVRDYLTEVRIAAQSELIGQPVTATNLGQEYNLTVIYARADSDGPPQPLADHTLRENDILLLKGTPQDIVNAKDALRLRPTADFIADNWWRQVESDQFHLGEITLSPTATIAGQTIKQINFHERYGLLVLAVRHNGVDQVNRLGEVPIQLGDSLLVQGPVSRFNELVNEQNWYVLESPDLEKKRTSKIPITAVILLAVIVAAAGGWLPVAAVMLAGALLVVLGKVLNMDEAYQAIDWKAIFVIAGMLPLGTAMESTGTAQLIADQIVNLSGGWGNIAVLCALFLLTALLTEVISNAAAAVLLVPIAIDVGLALQVNPQPYVMATVIAASTSFLMPIGHQVNIVIFGAGGYKFFDYTRVGIGLNLLLLAVVALFVPLIWPM